MLDKLFDALDVGVKLRFFQEEFSVPCSSMLAKSILILLPVSNFQWIMIASPSHLVPVFFTYTNYRLVFVVQKANMYNPLPPINNSTLENEERESSSKPKEGENGRFNQTLKSLLEYLRLLSSEPHKFNSYFLEFLRAFVGMEVFPSLHIGLAYIL